MTSQKEPEVKKSMEKVSKNNSVTPGPEFVKDSDVLQVIRYLKVRKASGPDGISNSVIRNFPRSLIKLLTTLILPKAVEDRKNCFHSKAGQRSLLTLQPYQKK